MYTTSSFQNEKGLKEEKEEVQKVNCSFHSTFETKLNIKDYDVMIYILNLC